VNTDHIIAAIGDYYDAGQLFIGIIRAVSLRREGGPGPVAKAVLADSVFFSRDAYVAELNAPWYQVPIEFGCGPVGAVDAPRRSWDPLSTISPQFKTLDPIDYQILADAFAPGLTVRDHTGQPCTINDLRALLPQLLGTGRVWDAVACLRARVRVVEEAIHVGSQGTGLLAVHRVMAPIEFAAPFRSPYFEHMDQSAAENGGGVYKYLIPTHWWDAMLEVKQQRMGA